MADIIRKPTKSKFKRMAVQLGYARLRELAEADRDGRVVVKPCKVGDTLFRVFAGEILEHKVRNMRSSQYRDGGTLIQPRSAHTWKVP